MVDKRKCKVCRFRNSTRCVYFETSCKAVLDCNIHLLHGDWDQMARTKKATKKEITQRKLEDMRNA